MKFIGAHVSAAGGVEHAPRRADDIGAKAFAIFTKNQRRWFSHELTEESIQKFRQEIHKLGFSPRHVLPHDSYLINLGNPDATKREKSFNAFLDELRRVEKLGLELLNFHPGSHLGLTTESECINTVADCLNRALEETEYAAVVIENTAGQGNLIGYRFEHLRDLIDLVHDKSRIGVCLDTSHTFAAGYDLRSHETCRAVFAEFDRIVGFTALKGMHLNDSKHDYASKMDRHASLGEGSIGWEAFKYIAKDPRFDDIPLILETPKPEDWKDEIAQLYRLAE
jgi:deoxyribonuclease IV